MGGGAAFFDKDVIILHADRETVHAILARYGFRGRVVTEQPFIDAVTEEGWVKLIFGVTLDTGEHLVVKILHEDGDIAAERRKIERQSAFSEAMRGRGILTPRRYQADGQFCTALTFKGIPCAVTVEDHCGEELTYINADLAYCVGSLMAGMHILSLDAGLHIGCGTLFSAAYDNDVDAFDDLCTLCQDERIDQITVEKIKALRTEKLTYLRSVWDQLPKCAVQGDVSINNLVWDGTALTVFDYNNAGDEVLISDLVMEGLLTAYEMELQEGAGEEEREQFFPAFLRGYLSVRRLSPLESRAAWTAYTLWHGLWFTRIVYSDHSLQKLVEKGDYAAANALLGRMLQDMMEEDDGRFDC